MNHESLHEEVVIALNLHSFNQRSVTCHVELTQDIHSLVIGQSANQDGSIYRYPCTGESMCSMSHCVRAIVRSTEEAFFP